MNRLLRIVLVCMVVSLLVGATFTAAIGATSIQPMACSGPVSGEAFPCPY